MDIDFIEEALVGKSTPPYILRYERGAKTFIIKYDNNIYDTTLVIVKGKTVTAYEANLLRIHKFIKDCLNNHRPKDE